MDFGKVATTGALTFKNIVVIHGPNGGGKTTLATSIGKSVIVLDAEDGSLNIAGITRVGKKHFKSIDDIKNFIAWVHTQTFETLVIDSLAALEDIIETSVCAAKKVKSITAIPYGIGAVACREAMTEIMHLLQKLRDEKNMNIIIVAHSILKSYTDPKTNSTYDRWIMRGNDKFTSVVKDLADAIYFLTFQVYTEDNKLNPAKTKAYSNDERVLHTVWSHAYDAKRRVQLPNEIVFGFDDIATVVDAITSVSSEDLNAQITSLKLKITDPTLLEKIDTSLRKAGDDVAELRKIKLRLSELAS